MRSRIVNLIAGYDFFLKREMIALFAFRQRIQFFFWLVLVLSRGMLPEGGKMDCLPSQVGGLSNCWLVPHLNTLDPVSLYPLKHWTRASSPNRYCLVVSVTNPFLIIGNVGHRAPANQKPD